MVARNKILFWFVLLSLACLGAANLSGEDKTAPSPSARKTGVLWCHRHWPSPGIWKGVPPYWQPNDCPNANQIFDARTTKRCLKGRTVYSIGNSIARQAPFGLVEMLGGSTVTREKQRDMCPKHDDSWSDSCHQEYGGVKLKYLYLQYMDGYDYSERMGFPYVRQMGADGVPFTGYYKNSTSGERVMQPGYFEKSPYLPGSEAAWLPHDHCSSRSTRACLQDFFKGSTESDVLIFTLGSSYGFKAGEPPLDYIDMRAWLRASAAAFRENVAASFKGQTFFVSLAPPNLRGYMSSYEPLYLEVNKVLAELWAGDWFIIDQWAINEGRTSMYQDHLHFNGPLTHAMLHQVLNELCPGKGTNTASHNPNPNINYSST